MKKIVIFAAAFMMGLGNTIFAKGLEEAFGTPELNASKVAVLEKKGHNIYSLVYSFDEKISVKVNLVDSKNNILHTRTIYKQSSILPYDFSYMPEGEYRFELISDGDTVVKYVHHYKVKPVIKIDPLDKAGKFKVSVKGAFAHPVSIHIMDEADNLVYEDTIREVSSFDRIYDLSALKNKNFKFNVYYNETSFSKTVQK